MDENKEKDKKRTVSDSCGLNVVQILATVVTSSLIVAGTLIGIGALGQYHFAGANAVKKSNCILSIYNELLSLQIKEANAYARYINSKSSITEARMGFYIDDEGKEKQIEDELGKAKKIAMFTERRERAWMDAKKMGKLGEDLNNLLRSGELCPDKGGPLWIKF